jgi:hypothetical protein
MDHLPPFRMQSASASAFFALAVTSGHYVRGRTPNEPACLVLYYSASPDFAPFSWMTIAPDGARLSYHRGDEFLTTPEYAILSAQVHEGIPARSWLLYPRQSVDDAAFSDAPTRAGYRKARQRLCILLRQLRIGVGVAPLFVADGRAPDYYDAAAENAEISDAVKRLVADGPGRG